MIVLFRRPSEPVIGYTAGIIDGEGSIHFSKQAGRRSHRANVSVSQSEGNNGETLLRSLQADWGIGTVCRQTKRGFAADPERNWPMWHWSVAALREVEYLLTECLPYLRVKSVRAVEAIAWCRERLASGARVRWAPGEDLFISEYWREHDAWIAEQIGRTEQAVRHRRVELGFAPKPPGGLTLSRSA